MSFIQFTAGHKLAAAARQSAKSQALAQPCTSVPPLRAAGTPCNLNLPRDKRGGAHQASPSMWGAGDDPDGERAQVACPPWLWDGCLSAAAGDMESVQLLRLHVLCFQRLHCTFCGRHHPGLTVSAGRLHMWFMHVSEHVSIHAAVLRRFCEGWAMAGSGMQPCECARSLPEAWVQ